MPGDHRLLLSLQETRWAIHIRTRRFIADAVRRALLFLKYVVEVGAALRILPILTMLCLLLVFIGSHHIFSPPLYTKNYLRQPYAFDPRRLQPPTPLSSSTIFLLRLFFALLCLSFVGTSIFFYKSMFSNPRPWSLEELKHQTEVLGRKSTFCYKCRRYRPARTHHCRYCDKCVQRMDHHCPFISNCVGSHNHKNFFMLQILVTLSCLLISTFGVFCIKNNVITQTLASVTLISFCGSLGITQAVFVVHQIYLMTRNSTTLEHFEKLSGYIFDREPIRFEFDTGWKKNIHEVWNS